MKVNTDGVLLGASVTLTPEDSRVLDIGTGTGTIALMIAQRLSDLGADCRIEGIDIDGPSAQEAEENFAASPWGGMLKASHRPLEEEAGGEWDCIVSNPPYFENSLKAPSERRSMARHDCTLTYREIIDFAAERLKERGRLSLVLPAAVENEMLRYAGGASLHPFRLVRISTTARKAPARIIVELSRKRGDILEEKLVLQEGPARTEQYSELTKDFYL